MYSLHNNKMVLHQHGLLDIIAVFDQKGIIMECPEAAYSAARHYSPGKKL